MSILKIVPLGPKIDSQEALSGKIAYIIRAEATKPSNIISSTVDEETAYEEMIASKRAFLSENNDTFAGRLFYEIIVSLDAQDDINLTATKVVFYNLERFFSIELNGTRQVLGAIHTNTDNIHCHYIINTTRITDGKRLTIGLKEMYDIKRKVDTILTIYRFSPLRMHAQ